MNWIILPLAILRTKPILRQLLAETKRTNELLTRIAARGLTISVSTGCFPQPDMNDDQRSREDSAPSEILSTAAIILRCVLVAVALIGAIAIAARLFPL